MRARLAIAACVLALAVVVGATQSTAHRKLMRREPKKHLRPDAADAADASTSTKFMKSLHHAGLMAMSEKANDYYTDGEKSTGEQVVVYAQHTPDATVGVRVSPTEGFETCGTYGACGCASEHCYKNCIKYAIYEYWLSSARYVLIADDRCHIYQMPTSEHTGTPDPWGTMQFLLFVSQKASCADVDGGGPVSNTCSSGSCSQNPEVRNQFTCPIGDVLKAGANSISPVTAVYCTQATAHTNNCSETGDRATCCKVCPHRLTNGNCTFNLGTNGTFTPGGDGCCQAECTLPTIPVGVANWRSSTGNNCASGAVNVVEGTTCTVTPAANYTCVSPGECQPNHTFAKVGYCQALCSLPNITYGVGGWTGANCASGATDVVEGTNCTVLPASQYICHGPGMCYPNHNFDMAPYCEALCTVPEIPRGVAAWDGTNCGSGRSDVVEGTTCTITADSGFVCTSPGLCSPDHTFAEVGECKALCTVPTIPVGVGSWSGTNPDSQAATRYGLNCGTGATNVIEGTTCTITPADRYMCTSPGLCESDKSFEAIGECKALCTVPTISTGVANWTGENCESGSTTVVEETACSIIPKFGYQCQGPGNCKPDHDFAIWTQCLAACTVPGTVGYNTDNAEGNITLVGFNPYGIYCAERYTIWPPHTSVNYTVCGGHGQPYEVHGCKALCTIPIIEVGVASWNGSGTTPERCISGATNVVAGTTCSMIPMTGYVCYGPGLCSVSGNFTALETKCEVIRCTLPVIEGAAWESPCTGVDVPYLQECGVVANTGHTCTRQTVTCNSNAEMDFTECPINTCEVPEVTGGTWTSPCTWTSVDFGQSCTVLPNTGHTCHLSNVVCNADGTMAVPICEPKKCQIPQIDGGAWNHPCTGTHIEYGSHCTLVASEGQLCTQTTVSCNADGTIASPHCQAVTCAVNLVTGGTWSSPCTTDTVPYQTTCTMIPNTGHTCSEETTTCEVGGTMQHPTCQANRCTVPSVAGAAWSSPCTGTSVEYSTSCTLLPDTGHTCSTHHVTCNADGSMTHPTCQAIKCNVPQVQGGAWNSPCAGSEVDYQTTCTLVPDTGQVCSTMTVSCNADGTMVAPSCQVVTCQVPSVTGGSWNAACLVSPVDYPTQCVFTPNGGYICDSTTVSCEADGTMASPTCQATCTVPDITIGVETWDGTNCQSGASNVVAGTTCTITPRNGHICTSPGLCKADGSFTNAGAQCQVVCNVPHIPDGVASWSGLNCQSAAADVVAGTYCEITSMHGWDCTSPGLCRSDGSFSGDGGCVAQAMCEVPDIPAGAANWTGDHCRSGATNIIEGTTCMIQPDIGYHCTSPGLCRSDATFQEKGACEENQCTCENGAGVNGTNCITHNGALCASCNDGYTLTSTVCEACAEHCDLCDDSAAGPGACQSGGCSTGYHFMSSTKTCEANTCTCANGVAATAPNCTTQTGAICASCDNGYTLNGVTCEACAANCDNCDLSGSGKCDTCGTGYHVLAGNSGCEANSCTCTNGVAVNGTSCTSHTGDICASCNSGYTLSTSDTCEACAAHCINCVTAGSGKCDTCSTGYHVKWQFCEVNTCTCTNGAAATVENCVTDGGAICASCASGYTLNGDACEAATCAISHSNQQPGPDCACETGYTGSINWQGSTPSGTCQANTCTCTHGTAATGTSCTQDGGATCASCSTGYVMNAVHPVCEACASNCDNCDALGAGKCNTCSTGYTVKSDGSGCEAVT